MATPASDVSVRFNRKSVVLGDGGGTATIVNCVLSIQTVIPSGPGNGCDTGILIEPETDGMMNGAVVVPTT